jgi:hypothetical protein
MTLRFPFSSSPVRPPFSIPSAGFRLLAVIVCLLATCNLIAQNMPSAAGPDVLVLSNGDALHGKFVSEAGGKVTFHTDALGDVSLGWDKIKELHASQRFAVLEKSVKLRGKKDAGNIPVGTFDVADQAVTVHSETTPAIPPIPVKDAQYVMDEPTLNKAVNHQPSFLAGWNGAATAGAAIVSATQKQYTVSGGVALTRAVPTVSWLNPRDRTLVGFTGSYGKITQPGYFAAGVFVPETVTKSAIYHAAAERDQYFSPRFYALAQTAFDHNFSQDLQLQQIYGGGIGFTVFKSPKQEADLKATLQYEKQTFIDAAPGSNLNLFGSTFEADYIRHVKLFTYTQSLAYIPAYNQSRAYSANETDTIAFPTFKNLSFSLGTTDSYLNDPPASLPPTERNSFQFTMGLSYAIKSKY